MAARKALRSVGVAACLTMGLLLVMAGGAFAATLNVCVPEKEGADLKTEKAGTCPAKFTPSRLMPLSQVEELEKIKQHMVYQEHGVDGKTTITLVATNVQVDSGGTEEAVNGLGNLVVGENDNLGGAHNQGGSNNLVVGDEQSFSSYGGFVAGYEDSISKPFATVSGGEYNTASGQNASVSGGEQNIASGPVAWISGGLGNTASSGGASISGGVDNLSSGPYSSVSGGFTGVASGEDSWVGGGYTAHATGAYSTVTGGENSKASGTTSSVDGGVGNEASGFGSWIGGGGGNKASGSYSSIFGGVELKATKEFEAKP